MKKLRITTFLSLILLSSCAHNGFSEQEKIMSYWEGRSVKELDYHPFFSQIPLEEKFVNGKLVQRIYEEPGKFRSKASCVALGGCVGLPSEYCQNRFDIRDELIVQVKMKGSCLTNKNKAPDKVY